MIRASLEHLKSKALNAMTKYSDKAIQLTTEPEKPEISTKISELNLAEIEREEEKNGDVEISPAQLALGKKIETSHFQSIQEFLDVGYTMSNSTKTAQDQSSSQSADNSNADELVSLWNSETEESVSLWNSSVGESEPEEPNTSCSAGFYKIISSLIKERFKGRQ